MKGLTDYITHSAWSDILTVSYVPVDDSHQAIRPGLRLRRKFAPQETPEFSDSEVITIALFGEMVFKGDENKTLHVIRQYHLDMFPQSKRQPPKDSRQRRLHGLLGSKEFFNLYRLLILSGKPQIILGLLIEPTFSRSVKSHRKSNGHFGTNACTAIQNCR